MDGTVVEVVVAAIEGASILCQLDVCSSYRQSLREMDESNQVSCITCFHFFYLALHNLSSQAARAFRLVRTSVAAATILLTACMVPSSS